MWAEQDRRERAVQSVYTDLFSVFQRQQRLGESFEVVFGLGFLIWNAPDGHMVRRHLITAHVTVSFDTERATLTVTPAGEGARPSLEQDMLDPQYRPDPEEPRSIEETLEQLGESLWAAGPLDGRLKSWVHSASSEGEYTDALERPERAASAPMVHLAPALILRRRTERSFIRAFQEIIDQLNSDHPVPEGCRTFVSVSDDSGRANASGESGHAASPGEIYFPLPANEAQREITELERDLDRQRRREARVLADLRAIRERETERDAGFGYSGTLARISAELHQERESLSWIQDETPEDVEPPLSAAECDELVSLGRNERLSQWEAGERVSIELDGLPTSALQGSRIGALATLSPAERAFEQPACLPQVRVQAQGRAIRLHRRRDLPLSGECAPQSDVCIGEGGSYRQRAAELDLGLCEARRAQQYVAEIEVRVRVGRVQRQGPAVVSRGRAEVAGQVEESA